MKEAERKQFGEYIKSLREKAGFTLREVAPRLGISNAFLSQIEQGARNPPKQNVLRNMAREYDVNFESLLIAAKLNEPKDEETFFSRLDEAAAELQRQLENAFEFVRRDKDFRYGTYMTGDKLTPEAKRFIVEVYQEMTGTQLLKTKQKGGK